MSHTIECGCVIADSKDRAVRLGYELGGYVKEFCAEHGKDDGEVIEDLQQRIDELEAENVMINKRLDWTVADNAKKAICIEELESAITNYDDCDSAAQSRRAMDKMLKLVNKEVVE